MFDIVVKGGRIIDGTGNPWFYGDVLIKDGKIVDVGKFGEVEAAETIDARGLTVTPGFIDMHGHYEYEPLMDPPANQMECLLQQGITTGLTGNCGNSAAPVFALVHEPCWVTIDNPSPEILVQPGIMTYRLMSIEDARRWFSRFGCNLDWRTTAEYHERLRQRGIPINLATLTGHNNLRAAVMGFEQRKPTEDEFRKMEALLVESLEQGSLGLSTGLVYPPSSFADLDELVRLAKVVAKHNGIYASHIRGEQDFLSEAIREAIEVGRLSGAPVEISHIKALGKSNWGESQGVLEMIEAARSSGVDVTCDQYPYTAQGVYCLWLTHMLPKNAFKDGIEGLCRDLASKSYRETLKKEIASREGEGNLLNSAGWDRIMIIGSKNKGLEGKTVAEISRLTNSVDPFDAALDLIVQEKGIVPMIAHLMCEEDIENYLRFSSTMVGTDSYAPVAPGIFGKGIISRGKPTPRQWGTFPRILGRYVRDRKLIRLEEAIRKMTGQPAARLGIKDRGLVRKNMWADIVVFDADRIRDRATWVEPRLYPEGIEYVLVNGKVAVRQGKYLPVFAGQVLLRGQ
jgi:N-acyl-D-amino-acid deacylase